MVLGLLGAANASSCPLSFQRIGRGCYFYGYFKLNWFRAMEFCHSFGRGASLATLDTPGENRKIKTWLLEHGDPNTGAWLGGSDNGHHGTWAWFPTGQLIQWFDWGPGQPSGRDQHCLYIVGGFLGYQWADFHCEFEMTFLCEYRVNRGDVWTHPRLPSYSPVQQDNRWQLSTIRPPPPSSSSSSTLPTSKPASRPTSATSTTPRPTLFSLFDIPAKEIEKNLVEGSDLVEQVQGTKNQIEVISRDKSSVIFQKKDQVVVSESFKQEDDTSWSIFQFLKNVIKMPALLTPSASYV